MHLIKEWTSSIRTNFEQRLSNPLLGAFSVSWVFFNWKALLFLSVSDKSIEDKISIVEESYSDLTTVLVYPLISAAVLTLALPWVSYWIQVIQEYVNKRGHLRSSDMTLKC